MKKLPEEFEKGGFFYKQVCRDNKMAVYSQHKTPDSPPTWYEVIIIRKNPERYILDTLIPEHESFPSSEQWGSQGWTRYSLEDAGKKMAEVRKRLSYQGHGRNLRDN